MILLRLGPAQVEITKPTRSEIRVVEIITLALILAPLVWSPFLALRTI